MREPGRGDLQPLERAEDGDRRRDDPVAEEERRPEDAERHQRRSAGDLVALEQRRSAMIPPSPRLWARMMKPAYLIETTIISAQKISETTP